MSAMMSSLVPGAVLSSFFSLVLLDETFCLQIIFKQLVNFTLFPSRDQT